MYEEKKGGQIVEKKNKNRQYLNDRSYFSFWIKIRM